jgi:glucokinase
MRVRYAVGVDVGATKILAGVIDCQSGDVVGSAKLPSPTGGAEGMLAQIEQGIADAMRNAPKDVAKKVERIGLGVAGQVDTEKGVLLGAPNLGGGITTTLDLGKPLERKFGVRVVVGNDVEAAALGEARFGAGRGKKLFACVFVGTGIGGALMVNGERYRGASGSAGELGHVTVHAGGRLCGCGQRGHLEAYSSRTAIVSMLREEVEAGTESSIRDILLDTTQRVKSKPLSVAVAEGDLLVTRVMHDAGLYLGLGLAGLINVWNPERIVLGGGVIDRIDLLFNSAAEHARRMSLAAPAEHVDIVRAELGDNSGMVGAALLGEDRGGKK